MLTSTIQSNYQKHLYFDNTPTSKEFSLDKCIKVLGLIAILKDKNQSIINFSNEFYGKNENGMINTTEREFAKFNNNLETIKRLKSYYNYCLSKVKSFK
jgi:hypothetical protein